MKETPKATPNGVQVGEADRQSVPTRKHSVWIPFIPSHYRPLHSLRNQCTHLLFSNFHNSEITSYLQSFSHILNWLITVIRIPTTEQSFHSFGYSIYYVIKCTVSTLLISHWSLLVPNVWRTRDHHSLCKVLVTSYPECTAELLGGLRFLIDSFINFYVKFYFVLVELTESTAHGNVFLLLESGISCTRKVLYV